MQNIPTVQSTAGLRRTIRRINFVLRPLQLMEERNKKYGDFYQVKFKDAPPTIMTSNPQAIEDIFTTSPDKFDVGIGNKGLNFLLGNHSLILLDGKTHKNRRRLLMPSFHGESLQESSNEIVSITNKICNTWQTDKPFKVRPPMQEITLRVILNVVLGVDSGEKYERLRVLLTQLLETFNNPFSSLLIFFPSLQKDWGKFSPWGRFVRLKSEIRQLIYSEIQERRDLLASGKLDSRDIFSLLISAKDENGESLTNEELHDQLITLLFAGHETTASALGWLFYWTHYLPEVKEKLLLELASLGENPDHIAINNLPYLDAVISETLRIYPIASAAFGRIITKPISLMGHTIEPRTWILASIYSLHHREDLYPDPKQFKPERFLERIYSPYEYMPFGGGNRRCLGSALALLEMKLVTATILQSFELELVSKSPMLPVRRGITMAPPASFKMVVSKKNK